jgi:hypothetical protein
MTAFVFIDESGDPGNDLRDGASSPYYSELAFQIDKKYFTQLNEHVITWRYVLGRFTEQNTLPNNIHSLKRYITPLFELSNENRIFCSCVYLTKKDYNGPYFHGEQYNALKFRNFIHRKLLEFHFKCFPYNEDDIELIFDRYRMTKVEIENVNSYLANNWNLPRFGNITHIDSIYSELMQLTSQLVSSAKDMFVSHGNDEKRDLLAFIKGKDISRL